MTLYTIGADISKDHIDLHRLPDGSTMRTVNSKAGFKAILKWIADGKVGRIVFEPTGAYHKAFETFLGLQGLALSKVNPRQVRRFAEAAGKLAKTDRADAAILARFGLLLEPRILAPCSETMNDLKALHMARIALVKDRAAAKNRAKNLTIDILKRQNAQRLKQIDTQIEAIDQDMAGTIAADDTLKQRLDILVSIPGISDISALAILIEMPELGELDEKAVASLAGLAPVARQSGTWKGRAFIRGGRALLRQALYMPALVATRFNPDLKAKYKTLKDAGKPSKVALTAIMRKLLILANALLRDKRKWTSKTA